MKCKKIFAMLLALCMVLTTFVVSVSAADVVVVDINEDYDSGIGDTLAGAAITLTTGNEGGREGVLVVNSSSNTSATGLVGFAMVDSEGNHIRQDTFPEEGTIEYSFDIYVPAEGGNVGNATFYMRTSNTFPPTGCLSGLDELDGLATGEWQTFEGTISDFSSFPWATDSSANNLPVWICIRPNFTAAGEFYIDNFSFTLTQTVEDEEDETAIAFTTSRMGNSIVATGDTYTLTAESVSDDDRNALNAHTGYIRVTFDEPLSLDEDWTLSYDLTTSGLVSSVSQIDTWIRCFDNATGTTQANTVGFIKTKFDIADGTNTYVFSTDDFVAGGNSTAQEIKSVAITFNMVSIYDSYGDGNDGYLEVSNINVVRGLPEDEEGGGGQGGDEGGDDPIVPTPSPDPGPGDDEEDEPGEITYYNVVEIEAPLDDASELTWVTENVTVENAAEEIGGRTGVVKATGVANNNTSTVGMTIADNFAFQPGDTISYSVDVYLTSNATPNLWLRRHTGGLEPFNSNFKPALGTITAGQWVTITHECAFENLGNYDVAKAPQGWETPGKYALYLRADLGTIYLDNFTIIVEREFVPTIEEIEVTEVGADSVTFIVTADGEIVANSLADYITIDGEAVNPESVTAEAIDEYTTTVTVTGLAPNREYEVAVTGAMSTTDKEVGILEEVDCTATFTTIAEVEADASFSRGTFTYELESNLSDTQTVYVVLLRCKGNTVIETTVADPIELEAATPISEEIEVPALGEDEFYRFFAWTYEDGAIKSMADLIDLN